MFRCLMLVLVAAVCGSANGQGIFFPAPAPPLPAHGGFVRSIPLRAGETLLERYWITVSRLDTEKKAASGQFHEPLVTRLFDGWMMPDAIFEKLKLGPQGQEMGYFVMVAIDGKGRKAIVGVYENPAPVVVHKTGNGRQDVGIPTETAPPVPASESEEIPIPPRLPAPAVGPEESAKPIRLLPRVLDPSAKKTPEGAPQKR